MARPKPLGPHERAERDRLTALDSPTSPGESKVDGPSGLHCETHADKGAEESGPVPSGPVGSTAERRQLKPTDQKRLNRTWRRASNTRMAVICDGVGTPYNVGQIVRSAATFGVEMLWLAAKSATPAHPGSRKTSLGTERNLLWEEAATTQEAVAAAKAAGYWVVAVELATGALPLHEAPLEGDVCLVVGAEDHGCSPSTLAAVDAITYIPQPGKVGSLNVAVAAAVAMAEVRRRQWTAG